MVPSGTQWLELVGAVLVAGVLGSKLTQGSAWQPSRPVLSAAGQAAIARPARAGPTDGLNPKSKDLPSSRTGAAAQSAGTDTFGELQRLQERLAAVSLEQFTRNNERDRLEDSRRNDRDRAADVRLRLEQIGRELALAREDRDQAARQVLEQQQEWDARIAAQTAEERRRLESLSARLEDKSLEARVAADRLQYLESLNIETDELVAARARSADLGRQRDALSHQLDSLRLDLVLREQAASQARDWSLKQQQSELFQETDSRVRQLQSQAAALQDELVTLGSRDEESQAKISEIDDDQRRRQQELVRLEERRTELLAALRAAPTPLPEGPSRPS